MVRLVCRAIQQRKWQAVQVDQGGSKAFVLPRCDPEWRCTRSQHSENPPPGLASRQAGIAKAWWKMWDPGGVGGPPGHSNEVEHNFHDWAKELRNLGPFPVLEGLSAVTLQAALAN
eukprot:6573577-Heterocapsa_arctica.AAC.1